jgi:protein required for attachment to host cells
MLSASDRARVTAALHQQGKPLSVPESRNLLFIIADGEYVRFVRPAEDNSLHDEAVVESFSGQTPPADLAPEQPDASHTGSADDPALNPRRDLHGLEKGKFATTVAQWLDALAANEVFDELVIVAPPKTLAAIRANLNQTTAAQIVGTLPKDLMKVPDHALWPHLRWWIRPIPGAP